MITTIQLLPKDNASERTKKILESHTSFIIMNFEGSEYFDEYEYFNCALIHSQTISGYAALLTCTCHDEPQILWIPANEVTVLEKEEPKSPKKKYKWFG